MTKPISENSNPHPSSEDVDKVLDTIFESIFKAIRENKNNITLDKVDQTLNTLFEVINRVPLEGKDIKIPDFSEIL